MPSATIFVLSFTILNNVGNFEIKNNNYLITLSHFQIGTTIGGYCCRFSPTTTVVIAGHFKKQQKILKKNCKVRLSLLRVQNFQKIETLVISSEKNKPTPIRSENDNVTSAINNNNRNKLLN